MLDHAPPPSFHPAPTPEGAALVAALEDRASARTFDATRGLEDGLITELARLATRAPTAFHFQNWRFTAVRSPEGKARLKDLAFGQPKVAEAAVTYILWGEPPRSRDLPDRLAPVVAGGLLPAPVAASWRTMAAELFDANPQGQREEAIRSATLAAGCLMMAARAHGLDSCPMTGFDPEGVTRTFGERDEEVPVLLVAVGHPLGASARPKPRRPVAALLTLA
ncbi:MAG: nitroreductase family protein [Rhodospirillum sp.]|nr:nitroreductase family protein [Rhodospirillum sp.]MCF8490446.1 nitroreductase family protein [Rhodospirillum sp.]MCF8500459.1 nitroreductase family protein [Rhodospirillum sp.]